MNLCQSICHQYEIFVHLIFPNNIRRLIFLILINAWFKAIFNVIFLVIGTRNYNHPLQWFAPRHMTCMSSSLTVAHTSSLESQLAPHCLPSMVTDIYVFLNLFN